MGIDYVLQLFTKNNELGMRVQAELKTKLENEPENERDPTYSVEICDVESSGYQFLDGLFADNVVVVLIVVHGCVLASENKNISDAISSTRSALTDAYVIKDGNTDEGMSGIFSPIVLKGPFDYEDMTQGFGETNA
ncbi:hypothetical protein IW146_008584 [Coemansia sp. RSA 922]|nr:hypothetical protein IW146_008584 [Coemansia sp. RSA 922]